MPTTLRTDLVDVQVLIDAIQAEFAGMSLLLNSGAAVMSNTLPGDKKGGDSVIVPYFEALGEMEDVPEGDALTPEKLSMTQEEAFVVHSGKAVELSYWSRLAAEFTDPYAEVARQFRTLVERRVDKALLDVAMASLPVGNIHDVYNSGTPVKLGYDVCVDAKTKFGDEQDNIVMLGVHSKVLGDLLKERDGSTGQPLVRFSDAGVGFAGGMTVKTSDKNAVSSDSPPKYTSIIAKRSSLAFWYQGTPRVVTGYDPLADTDVLAIHMYWVAHRYKRIRGAGTKTGIVKIITN